jgi:hypothetical protein
VTGSCGYVNVACSEDFRVDTIKTRMWHTGSNILSVVVFKNRMRKLIITRPRRYFLLYKITPKKLRCFLKILILGLTLSNIRRLNRVSLVWLPSHKSECLPYCYCFWTNFVKDSRSFRRRKGGPHVHTHTHAHTHTHTHTQTVWWGHQITLCP